MTETYSHDALMQRVAELEAENAELSRMVSLEMTQAQEIGTLRAEIERLRAHLAQSWQPVTGYASPHGGEAIVNDGLLIVVGVSELGKETDAAVIIDDDIALCRRAAPDPLGHIVEAIRRERAYQDAKWGTIEQNPHHIYQWAELLFEEAREAMQVRHSNNRETLMEVLQAVAAGIACLEQHGVVERPQGVTP